MAQRSLHASPDGIQPAEKGNSEGTIALLKYLLAQHPNSRIALIWDGATYHRSQAVKDYTREIVGVYMGAIGYFIHHYNASLLL